MLTDEATLYKNHFGKFYDDLLIMSSNMVEYRPNRDKLIFNSFKLLYRLLAARQPTAPRFLAFYGIGHLDNLGTMLQENDLSPVKGKLGRIGIQYVNCLGGWNTPTLQTVGLYRTDKQDLEKINAFANTQSWQAALLTGKSGCLNFKRGSALDAVFIFNRYGDRKMNSWKFD
jgi:hypothetical protein